MAPSERPTVPPIAPAAAPPDGGLHPSAAAAIESNRALWTEWSAIHERSSSYDVEDAGGELPLMFSIPATKPA